MKNIYKYILMLGLVFNAISCDEDPDNAIYTVLDYEKGAALRTIEVINASLNSSDPSSTFAVTVEEQDAQDGGLMESVDIYVSLRDLSPDNGTTDPNRSLVKTIAASEFSEGPVGLPRATLTVTFGEAVAAMGISDSDYTAGDVFIVDLVLNLTDGRSLGPESSSGVLTGVFFKAPFQYNALLTCSPEPGDYTVRMFDSYGDGWQTDCGNGGSGITIVLDNSTLEVGLCSPYSGCDGAFLNNSTGGCTPNDGSSGVATVTIPDGTLSAEWNFPGDNYGEIRFEVYAPNGDLVYDSGDFGEQASGLLPITVCAQ
ncbi:hypothetical protein ACFSYG_12400 [Leeuwenhoekiella polynyae]|uniref:Uncharacterized protein n=1 Tax=Leeuwenhoekiella polynyae TaxID=1550906 RepID=A0A4Q0NPU2_9FLAO|nr:hypothetical protein [Leeuwenhoekiella polynyae]RXG12485.1 hypothetical protein DSM02_3862 [Leeuwenhoekiella polynyae]